LLRGRDIKRYKAEFADLYLICTFPVLKIDIEQYPAIKNHLLSFGKRLHQTGETFLENGVSVSTRKKTGNKWFETQDQIAYYQDFEKEKIVWKRVGSILCFSYVEAGFYCLDSTCFIATDKARYLAALLNSKVCHHELFETAPKTGVGDLIISVQALEPIHIPQPSEDLEKVFVELVDKILALKKAGKPTHSLEKEIDELVFEAYGLSAAGRALVLGG